VISPALQLFQIVMPVKYPIVLFFLEIPSKQPQINLYCFCANLLNIELFFRLTLTAESKIYSLLPLPPVMLSSLSLIVKSHWFADYHLFFIMQYIFAFYLF